MWVIRNGVLPRGSIFGRGLACRKNKGHGGGVEGSKNEQEGKRHMLDCFRTKTMFPRTFLFVIRYKLVGKTSILLSRLTKKHDFGSSFRSDRGWLIRGGSPGWHDDLKLPGSGLR